MWNSPTLHGIEKQTLYINEVLPCDGKLHDPWMVSAYPLRSGRMSGLENHSVWSELCPLSTYWFPSRTGFGEAAALYFWRTGVTPPWKYLKHYGPNISPQRSALTSLSNEAVATEHPRKPQLERNHGKMVFPLARPPSEGWWQCQDPSAEILNAISYSEQIQCILTDSSSKVEH